MIDNITYLPYLPNLWNHIVILDRWVDCATHANVANSGSPSLTP